MDAGAFSIRLYSPSDLEAAVDLWHEAWHREWPGERHAYAIEQWRDRWREAVVPKAVVWVAAAGENGDGSLAPASSSSRLAGYVAVFPRAARFNHLVVDPGFGLGNVAAQLIEKAKWAYPTGLSFEVFERDGASRTFYEGHGFVAGRRGVHPRSGLPTIEYSWGGGAS